MDRTTLASRGRRDVLPIVTATLLGVLVVAMVGILVVSRQGNLAWDDADYLRRGLRLARLVDRDGVAGLAGFLDERPKPPLYVGWIEAAALAVGRQRVGTILVLATALPFGLTLAAAIALARARYGPRASVLAVALIAASPMALAYGARVMVETLLGLWLLAAVAFATATRRAPDGRAAWGLGAALGLAAMTKATFVLFLPPIAFGVVASPAVWGLSRRERWRLAARVLIPAAAIAGPWYAAQGPEAFQFARHSSRFVVDVEGREAGPPAWTRPAALTARVAGWPAVATVAVVAIGGLARRRPGDPGPGPGVDDFGVMALAASAFAGLVLLVPQHFDPRFLLPIWPAAAVGLAGFLAHATASRPALRAVAVAGVLAGVAVSSRELLREPPRTTHWAASALIDELRGRYGVRMLVNIGDAPDWNVCKTGLINELRADPDDCFVLHDLSRLTGPALGERLGRAEALVILDPVALPREAAIGAPGLNRAWSGLETRPELAAFVRVEPAAAGAAGLPPLSVLVRRELIERRAAVGPR